MKTDEETNEILKASKLEVAKKLANWYNIIPWSIVTIILVYIAFSKYKGNDVMVARSQSSTNNVVRVENIIPENIIPENIIPEIKEVKTNVVTNIVTDDFKIRQLQKLAVGFGYGKWEVSDEGITTFFWIEPKDWRDKRIIEKVTSTNMVVQIDLNKINGWLIDLEVIARTGRSLNIDLIRKIETYTNTVPQSREFDTSEKDLPLRYSPKEAKFADSIGFNVESELNDNILMEVTSLITKWDGINKATLIDSIKKTLAKEVKNVFDGFNEYYKIK